MAYAHQSMEATGLRFYPSTYSRIARLLPFVSLNLACAIFLHSGAYAGAKKIPEAEAKAAELTNFEQAEIPKFESLASEMGFSPKELSGLSAEFANALSQGMKSAGYAKLCARHETTCKVLGDYYSQMDLSKEEREELQRRRNKRFRITTKNVDQAERFDFQVLVSALKIENEYELFELAEKSLKVADCPRNLAAALSVRAEEFFPHKNARTLAKELFEHARHCLKKEDKAYERLFLRQGLYSLYEGEKKRAKEYFKKAVEAEKPKEKYRSLYWLGRIEHEEGEDPEDNKYWHALLEEYPLSFYSIDASLALGKDPIQVITNRKLGGMQRSVADEEEINWQIRWLEALYLQKKYSAVAKWASWVVRGNEDLPVQVLHYVSALKIASGLYRSNINMLFGYFKKNPSTLNEEGLKLLYPRPFYSIIESASRGKIDTFLVLGLVRQESAFEAKAVSRAKAKGLMQIIPQTAKRLERGGHRKLLNEKENTRMGVKYLMQLGQQFEGSAELVLAAYNAGPMKVEEWLKRNPEREKNILLWNDLIPYMETRDYVVSILRNNYFYSRLYSDLGGGDVAATAGAQEGGRAPASTMRGSGSAAVSTKASKEDPLFHSWVVKKLLSGKSM